MGYVHVAHDCHIGDSNILANYTGLSGHVTLDNYVTLGGQNGVAQFLRVGSYVYTGAASLIDRNVPPYATGYGNRFEVKGVNIVGLKRQNFSRESIGEILEAHRIYYRSELKSDEALRVIEETFGESAAVRAFLDFIYSAEWMWLQVFEYGEIEDADIDISSWELNYPYVENGNSYSLSLDVTNNGNSTLIIEDQYISNTDFQVVNPLQNLGPGETQTVNIIYFADAGNSSSGYLIFTNDPDEPQITVELNGNIDGINIGEPAPDFELDIIANGSGSFHLSDHLGQIVVLAFFAPG